MDGPPLLGREPALAEADLCPIALLDERQLGERLPVVGVRWFPVEREREAGGRIDLPELAREPEGLAVRRLHRDPIAAAHARIELDLRDAEARWTPPFGELPRVRQRLPY